MAFRELGYLSYKYTIPQQKLRSCMNTVAEHHSIDQNLVVDIVYEKDSRPIEICHQSSIGLRPTNEDAHVITRIKVPLLGGDVTVAGVFDGHAGAEVSFILSTEFATYLETDLNKLSDDSPPVVSQAIQDSIRNFDESLRSRDVYSGSTLTLVVITNDTIYTANLGDSRVIIFTPEGLLFETKDHKPNDPDELKRIEDAGGRVINVYGVYRVNGNLSLSRAIGDFSEMDKPEGKPYSVSNIADVTHMVRTRPVFILLACDGVWDVMDSKSAYLLVQQNPEMGCKTLVDAALSRGSTDNVTALLLSA